MTEAVRQLAVCVDDFGLHDGVNQAVFELLSLRRISAVSCLVDGPSWASGAAALRRVVEAGRAESSATQPAAGLADVGLHLNFTETLDAHAQRTLPCRPLGVLIRTCYLRRFDTVLLVNEIERQWRRFEEVWGRAPDFVDGHQHVHQLPQIRDALLEVLRRRCPTGQPGHRPWIRQCRAPGWQALLQGISVSDTIKAHVIGALGAGSLGRAAGAAGFQRSQRLLGVYPFDADASAYLKRWRAWLALVRPKGDLLMCHPAVPTPQQLPWPDVIAASRHMEHAVLTGDAFASLLRQAGVEIVRLSRLPNLPQAAG